MTGPLQLADGTVSAPGLTFGSATGTGIFKTANGWAVTINGTQVFEFNTAPQGRIPGEIVAFGGGAAPSGWLFCAGQSLLRATYPALFSNIGTFHGAADGAHFSLPDIREVVIAGSANMIGPPTRGLLTGSDTFGATIGNQAASLAVGNLPSYTLPKTLAISDTQAWTVGNGTNIINGASGSSFGGGAVGSAVNLTVNRTGSVTLTGDTQSGGGNTPHANVQPTVILNYIIYTGVA
jgi:microcystin-dependent protein